MTPHDFIRKWQDAELTERAAAQSHFIDLCRMLDLADPVSEDPIGEWFTFEKGITKTTGANGWADVWRKGCFAWEYKGKHKNLQRAFAQLQQYAVALENPPLLIVSDIDRIEIHTNWTNTIEEVRTIHLPDLVDAATRDLLHSCFTDPERLRPAVTRRMVTEDAASHFAGLASRLRGRGHEGQRVAHFINRLVFCMFAEDARLLPDNMFTRMLEAARQTPESFTTHAGTLFEAMRSGGMVGFEHVEWFNGGLFDNAEALPLNREDIGDLLKAAALDWSNIDPSILGTLFERGLDPDKRSQLGAHYTDSAKIMQIIEPVIRKPLLAEWEGVKAKIAAEMEKAAKGGTGSTRAENRAKKLKAEFAERLLSFRVLDPACGSGNFLYLALLALKDLEHRINLEAEALGLSREFPRIGPEVVKGIELNPYAAELARVSVWIGEIQWMRKNGFDVSREPILRPLDTIENRDAVLNRDGTPADWPTADVVTGNPPFLGNKKMIGELGEEYALALRKAWPGVPGGADLVCYWFAKAWEMMRAGRLQRAGLVATNSIRGGQNREVLKPIVEGGRIYAAWSDEPWTLDGAAVRVSLVCFDREHGGEAELDGLPVPQIFSDLTASGVDLTAAARLIENRNVSFQGPVKVGPFDIDGEQARKWLELPNNPNGCHNSDVVRPLLNGRDITQRSGDRWIIDFGEMSEEQAAIYEAPFEYVRLNVKPIREKNRRKKRKVYWWQHGETVPGIRQAFSIINRAIFTPRVAKHRLFVWSSTKVVPDTRLVAITRDDDTTFGILHSRFHEIWSLALGGWHGVGNDPQYTPTLGFETFPFPEGLTPDIPAAAYAENPHALAIAGAARRLNELRENWLNPADLVERVPEVVPGYPERVLPVSEKAARELKKRTLTNLYNARPQWLVAAHKALDLAVADAYGWGAAERAGELDEEEILTRLFHLNQQRAAAQ